MLQILFDRITLGFSLSIPFKDFKCYEGGGDSGFQVTGLIEGFFGVWNFRFQDFFGWYCIDVGIFCVFKTIGSCHSYVIDETEDVLWCLECCLSFVGSPRDFLGGAGGLIFVLIREMEWLYTQLHIGYSRNEGDSIGGRYEGTDSWAKWTAPEKWNRTFAYHVELRLVFRF